MVHRANRSGGSRRCNIRSTGYPRLHLQGAPVGVRADHRRIAIGLVFVTTVAMSAAQKPAIPRTDDGHPDLQGTWSYATLTTLERPAEFKDKPFLTAAE